MTLSDDLSWRGFIKDKTFDDLSWINNPKTFYHGIDGSSDSLTIGNLAPLMLSVNLMRGGWNGVILVGGATSLVGDPGGKETERLLPDIEIISNNVEAIKRQVNKLFISHKPQVVNNFEWLKDLRVLDFLRDVGKHYPMTDLMQRDFISERMREGGGGISYAEFSYTLIQGYDFWHLHKNYNVQLQIGGSDQWGNMLSGVSIIRKKEGSEANALSMPLVINKSTGKKFGKSEEGAIWLDPKKTTPTEFYQFWINTDDSDVEPQLKIYTLLSKSEIESIMAKHSKSPAKRFAQQALASEVTSFVHGREETHTAEVITNVLTGNTDISQVSDGIVEQVRNEIASISVPAGTSFIEALVSTGLATSNSDARRLVASGAVYINNNPIENDVLNEEDFKNKRLIIRRGKAFKDSALVEMV
ncbi:tyrosine--tRNA ligase [Candidatus Saccharibacteria bacterium]|nr:tyrosine--tRNA ligase [Candidatus Saccharibacteria bacterium]